MLRSSFSSAQRPGQGSQPRASFLLLITLALLGLLLQPGCLFHGKKEVAPPLASPVRVVLFPLNIPAGNEDLRWVSLATTAQMEQIIETAPDLEAVPLWESLPAVLQTLQNSRDITPEIAAFTATRLTARWGIQGELMPQNQATLLRLDFMPSRASQVPFRYEKQTSINDLGERFEEGLSQFMSYLLVRPPDLTKLKRLEEAKLHEIGDALDGEYGWFVPAKPGEAGKLVEELAQTHIELARFLFSPTLYPVLAK